MRYFFTCDHCGVEIPVELLETTKYRSKNCPKCGADLVFQNSELQEYRITVKFRCTTHGCPSQGQPQDALITRTELRKMCQPDRTDKYFCPACGQLTAPTDEEKANTLRMLDEEAAQAQAS